MVPALKAMAASNPNKLARIHAAWTLEGLNSLDAGLVRGLLKDSDPKLRAQGARLSEILYKGGDPSFADDLKALASDADTDVAIQALLSLNYLKVPGVIDVATAAKAAKPAKGVQIVADRILKPPASDGGFEALPPVRTEAEVASLERGAQIFQSACGECHGLDGQGAPDGNGGLMAPALAGNPRIGQGSPEHVLRVMLTGLTDPINGKTYAAGMMAPQRVQNDQWIADVASYLRHGMTNGGTMVTPEMVAFIRADEAKRTEPYTDAELNKVQAQPLQPESSWKVTASRVSPVMIGGTGSAAGALSLEGWTTGEDQKPGQYWQVELPKVVNLAGLDYQALTSSFYSRPGAAPAAGGFNMRAPRVVYYPRGWKLEVSTNGTTWKTVKEGQGVSMFNSIMFAPTQAKFVRLSTTADGPAGVIWGMKYVKLFAKG